MHVRKQKNNSDQENYIPAPPARHPPPLLCTVGRVSHLHPSSRPSSPPHGLSSKRIGCWRLPTSVYHCPEWAKQRGDGGVSQLDSNTAGRRGRVPLSFPFSLTQIHTHRSLSLCCACCTQTRAHTQHHTAATSASLAAHQHPSRLVFLPYTLAATPHPADLSLLCCLSPWPRSFRRHGDQPAGFRLLWHQHQVAAQVLGR